MKALLVTLALLCVGAYLARRTVAPDPQPTGELPTEVALVLTRTMTVRVIVTRSLARDAEAVSGFECEIGLGIGMPSRRGPVPAERVLLAQGMSNSAGVMTFEIEIPKSWLERAGANVVWARPLTPGWKRRYSGTLIPRDGSAEMTVRVMAREGATLGGIVRLPNGNPANGCNVRLLEDDVKDGGFDEESETRTNRHGEFALHFDKSGAYHLLAKQGGVGTASVQGLEVDIDDPVEDLSLTLVGGGLISGIVVDPNGAPIRRYRIWACPADVPDKWVGYFHTPQQIPFELEGKGLYDDKVDTDDDGRFSFRGLRAGAYIIRGKTGSRGYYKRVLTVAPVETGTHDLAFELERYTLVVRVLDHNGERIQPRLKHYPEREAEANTIFCQLSHSDGRITQQNSPLDGSRMENGDVLFEVEQARSYAFGVISAREPLHEEVVAILGHQWQTLRTIKLGEPEPPGTLNVILETPDGEPMTDHSQVVILGPVTGISVAETGKYFDDTKFEVALAAGTYAVEVDAEPPRGRHGERFRAKKFMKVLTTAGVRSGARTDVTVPLGKGGNIELTLVLAGQPDDTRWPTAGGARGWDATVRDEQRGGRVLLTPLSEGKPIEPIFEHSVPGTRIGSPMESNWIAPDTTQTSPTLLRVGEYALLVQAKGYPAHEERITIEHGKVTRVAVLLKAE